MLRKVALLIALAGCSKPEPPKPPPPVEAPKPPPEPVKPAAAKRPELPGDFRAGWMLFRQNCIECHGEGRRGGLVRKDGALLAPADLRDPLLLVSKSNDELVRVISNGLEAKTSKGKKKGMPAFKNDLDSKQILDIVAFLRGDSIHLAECFASATHYVHTNATEAEPPVLAAYAATPAEEPRIVEQVPADAKLLGFVLFAEVDLPGAGPTPIAFVSDPTTKQVTTRVALPQPDNERAAEDLDAALADPQKAPAKLAPVLPQLAEGRSRLEAAAIRR